jgi:hypothetical protein
MASKLTPAMRELLDAMRAGVRLRYMPWGRAYDAHYYRSDTMKPCTKQAEALIARGLVLVRSESYKTIVELAPPTDSPTNAASPPSLADSAPAQPQSPPRGA